MARVSQTEIAVLGALSVAPMSGYAVREAIRAVLGHFWSESFGQIYPTLADLHGSGHVDRRDGDRPGSSTYAITPLGRDRLVSLLRSPDKPVPPRNGLLLRLFFGHSVGPDACRDLVQRARQDAAAQMTAYQAIRDELAAETKDLEHHPYWLLTVSAGEHSSRAAIAWADDALAQLDALSAADVR